MDTVKRKRLEEAGFRIGTVAEFLGLTPEQSELAERIGSSQSRIAKMERGDASVSLDLLARALITQGMTRCELAEVIAARSLLNGGVRQKSPKKRVQKPQIVNT